MTTEVADAVADAYRSEWAQVLAADTDWAQVVELYDLLARRWPSPVVALNRAIAIGAAQDPDAGLTALDGLADDPGLTSYPYLPAARAEFLRRIGQAGAAAECYREALLLTGNEVEARYLQRRLAETSTADPAS